MKPAIAFIHGWGMNHACWPESLGNLKESNDEFNLHWLDLPGYGKTPASEGETTFALRALPEKFVLCGHSLGALSALQIALRHPSQLVGLILVGATPCFTTRTDWPYGQAPEVLERFSTNLSENPLTTLHRFHALANQGDAKARSITRDLKRLIPVLPTDLKSLQQGLANLRELDLRDQIARITLPVHLIHGEKDPLMPLAAAHWLMKNLGAPNEQLSIDVFEGAAHLPFFNDPARFVSRIKELTNEFYEAY